MGRLRVLQLAVLAILAASTIAAGFFTWSDSRLLLERMETIRRSIEDDEDELMLTTKWTSGGVERSYTTTAREGESPESHAHRHVVELVEVQRVLPVDR